MTSHQGLYLGIGGSDHDFSAALVSEGKVLVAVEDERLNLIKHGRGDWDSLPCKLAAEYCLDTVGATWDQVEAVFSNTSLEERAHDWLPKKPFSISHHMAHAASSFLTSPHQEATLLVVDGAGSRINTEGTEELRESVSIGYGNDRDLSVTPVVIGKRHLATCHWRYFLTNSLGHFYRSVSEAIGFGHMGAGKTMGLASYGDNSLVPEMETFLVSDEKGTFAFDVYSGFHEWLKREIASANNDFMIRANIASAAQTVFENRMIALAKKAYETHPSRVLCLSGGCALNTVANARILQECEFDEVFVPPACGDSGTAIGSALWGYYSKTKQRRDSNLVPHSSSIAFTGRSYSKANVIEALDRHPVYWHAPADPIRFLTHCLSEGQVVGMYQGSSEIGQRALGHRSIIADPSSSRMRDHINLNVKFRESFRPLAPVIPEERAEEYFHVSQPSPFMSFVVNVKESFTKLLGAVTHVDGTARLQTVNRESNTFLHALLLAYEQNGTLPILVNTSFNIQGQPIVETPDDALSAFCNTDIDILYIDGFIAEKHTPWANRKISQSIKSSTKGD